MYVDHVPMTFVALEDDIPLGTGALWIHDCPQRVDLSPWLAVLYVAPEHRRRGVASALIRHRLKVLKALGYSEAYIWSSQENVEFHSQFGWKVFDDKTSKAVVMHQRL